jgi:hypothetical protein
VTANLLHLPFLRIRQKSMKEQNSNSPYSVLSKELNLEIQTHKPNESEKSRIWMGHMQKKLNQ